MKIVMCTDLEGVSGVVSFTEQAEGNGRYYEKARKLLTAEVNAAVEGMLEESVTEILVIDGHGAGGILFEDLHPKATLFHGCPMPWKRFCNDIVKTFDAAIMIGQHAMAGEELGTLNHTQSHLAIEYYKLNGRPIGEIGQFAFLCGAWNVPMIFLAGDDVACREAEALIPGVTTAAVKIGMSRTSAISYPPAEAHRRIREGIKTAVRQHRQKPVPPLQWKGPFVLEKKFFHTGVAEAWNSTATVIDPRTVQLHSENILDIIYA
jgi:D-amino peptidase